MKKNNQLRRVLFKLRVGKKVKDVFFRAIFSENRVALLQLYNALNETDYHNVNDLEIVTIGNAIYITMKNDVAFMVAGVINLYEHQSTWNPNMPVRFLIYLGQEYQKLVEQDVNSFYGSKTIMLPVPKCVVFYNGEVNKPEESYMHLSEAYMESVVKPDVELTVRVLNINYGCNEKLMKQCKLLSDYSIFVSMLRDNQKKYKSKKRAIRVTIEEAIEKDILRDFLRKHKSEVVGMLLTDFDRKKYERTIRSEGFDEGMEKGIAQGQISGQRILLIAMVRDGEITIESAAKRLNVTPEEFQRIMDEEK